MQQHETGEEAVKANMNLANLPVTVLIPDGCQAWIFMAAQHDHVDIFAYTNQKNCRLTKCL